MPHMITTRLVHGVNEHKIGDIMYIYYITRNNARGTMLIDYYIRCGNNQIKAIPVSSDKW